MFTAKAEGLWDPTKHVSTEDVRHLRNRVEEFPFMKVISSLKDVESCAPCMARWVLKYSEEAASGPVPAPMATLPLSDASTGHSADGFAQLMADAKMTGPVVDTLLADVAATAAVHVRELKLSDWRALPSWTKLRVMELRRCELAIVAASGVGAS